MTAASKERGIAVHEIAAVRKLKKEKDNHDNQDCANDEGGLDVPDRCTDEIRGLKQSVVENDPLLNERPA